MPDVQGQRDAGQPELRAVQGKEDNQGAGAVTVPIMPALRARVRLSVLGSTEPGDVFYLVSDPATVWWREAESCGFLRFDNECWFGTPDIGTGERGQRVVILHNTRKFCAVPAEWAD